MSEREDDYLDLVRRVSAESRAIHAHSAGLKALSAVTSDLDDRINFRVNSGLKREFEKVCSANHTTVSREIKRFMTAVVRAQEII